MTEDELVETMARAICKTRGFDVQMIFEDGSRHSREEASYYRDEARAALAALRAAGYVPAPVEPTEEMLRAAYSYRDEAQMIEAAIAASPLAKKEGGE